MKKVLLVFCIAFVIAALASCTEKSDKTDVPETAEPSVVTPSPDTDAPSTPVYTQITQEKAKEMMDSLENYVILDVRTEQEYDMGHIPGAMLIPDYEITEKAPLMLPDKDAVILVYCRSGNRSKTASLALVNMGYTNVYEFGGIITWEYEVTR